jgi:NAD(P)-dependent dehydrogenase (short-subunit alcohol dehydrogenase family)
VIVTGAGSGIGRVTTLRLAREGARVVVAPGGDRRELAATITWLLSDDASNVNGVILPSDGGWSAV